MSLIKNATVLVWSGLIDSYHADTESANQRAAFIVRQWQKRSDCGSELPRPRLEVMSAAQYIKKQYNL